MTRSWRAAVIEAEARATQGSPAFVYQLDWASRLPGGRTGAYHTSFARTGDPNHPGLPRWTPYSLERRETMVLDRTSRMENDPRGDERRFFGRIPYLQPGT